MAPRLEILGELHGEQIPHETGELFATIGARPKLTRQIVLLLAVGRTVRDAVERGPRTYLYTGLQMNLPDQYAFKDAGPRR